MTVKELKEKLKKYDPEAIIVTYNDYGWSTPDLLRVVNPKVDYVNINGKWVREGNFVGV